MGTTKSEGNISCSSFFFFFVLSNISYWVTPNSCTSVPNLFYVTKFCVISKYTNILHALLNLINCGMRSRNQI